jgi:brefeldin A-resistance guanine nucleotide exchange factor 1
MSFEQYKSNVRGINAGKDFSIDYLRAIYDAILSDEIVMPEEHEGQLGFNFAWKQLLHRAKSAGLFTVCDTAAYDKDIFTLAWKPAVAAISYGKDDQRIAIARGTKANSNERNFIFTAFNTAQDDVTLQKAITGFHQCALLSAHYQLHDVFDSIIVSLASMTGLVDIEDTQMSAPDPIVDVAGQKYAVSRLAVRFGRNYKGQLAAVVAFAVASEHGSVLRKGWIKVMSGGFERSVAGIIFNLTFSFEPGSSHDKESLYKLSFAKFHASSRRLFIGNHAYTPETKSITSTKTANSKRCLSAFHFILISPFSLLW